MSRIRLRYIFPAAAIALVTGLALAAFTSSGTVLGYTGFSHLTEERQGALSNRQTSAGATATTEQPAASEATRDPEISPDAAVEIAQTVASGPVDGLDIEWRGGHAFYEIEIGETDVVVDARDGSIVNAETDDRDDDDDWNDRNDRQAPAPGITIGEAIRAAEAETTGTVDDVELDYARGLLVYSIEIGQREVIVDATDGVVLSVHNDD